MLNIKTIHVGDLDGSRIFLGMGKVIAYLGTLVD